MLFLAFGRSAPLSWLRLDSTRLFLEKSVRRVLVLLGLATTFPGGRFVLEFAIIVVGDGVVRRRVLRRLGRALRSTAFPLLVCGLGSLLRSQWWLQTTYGVRLPLSGPRVYVRSQFDLWRVKRPLCLNQSDGNWRCGVVKLSQSRQSRLLPGQRVDRGVGPDK